MNNFIRGFGTFCYHVALVGGIVLAWPILLAYYILSNDYSLSDEQELGILMIVGGVGTIIWVAFGVVVFSLALAPLPQ